MKQGVIVGGVIAWGVIVRRAIGIGGNYPGGIVWGAVGMEAIVRGEIVPGAISRGVIVRGATVQGEIVLFPVSTCSFVSTKLALNYIKQARCS